MKDCVMNMKGLYHEYEGLYHEYEGLRHEYEGLRHDHERIAMKELSRGEEGLNGLGLYHEYINLSSGYLQMADSCLQFQNGCI